MFAWFQRLLPRTGAFFEQFEAHAAVTAAAADALEALLNDGVSPEPKIQAVFDREHDADDITRAVLQSVRRTFLTPFDRGAITSLIAAMDDTVDEMQSTVRAISIYDVHHFSDEMKQMAGRIVEASRVTVELMPLLRDVARNAGRLHQLTERLVRLEGEVDDIHAAGLKAAYRLKGPTDPLAFSVDREIFKSLEKIADAFEDVANEVDGIVIDHA